MRTGSNLVEANLNEFEGITCEGEVFNSHFISHEGKAELYGVTLAERGPQPDGAFVGHSRTGRPDGVPVLS